MANEEHLKILKQGAEAWNKWRVQNPQIKPDLSHFDFNHASLSRVNLSRANLSFANLNMATLLEADLSEANLYKANCDRLIATGATLSHADSVEASFVSASLGRCNFESSDLENAHLDNASLFGTNLTNAHLYAADFYSADLSNSNMHNAILGYNNFANSDLRKVKHLESCEHYGPSIVDHGTLILSGKLPVKFLRGCGLPDNFIAYIPSLFYQTDAVQFYSCFISYSSIDAQFAKRLYSRMRDEDLRVWYAPEDMKGGDKLVGQIDHAIRVHDKLLLLLSKNSIKSEWVTTEIYQARQREIRENRRVLFPIRLCEFEMLRDWQCFDADTGKDLAREIREYFIPDFSNWKNHDAFEESFKRLISDLKAEEPKET